MEDYLMISGLQHFAFCRRQWALIHLEQQWEENILTVQGQIMHKKAHSETTEVRGDKIITRSLRVCSHSLQITGICDIVEFNKNADGISLYGHTGLYSAVPVEYKRGRPKQHNADALQLCAQAVCLEEMLCCSIPKGYLFYGEKRSRTEVIFDNTLRSELVATLTEMQQLYKRGHTPIVKVADKCKACSLQNICLPVLMKKHSSSAKSYISKTLTSNGGDI